MLNILHDRSKEADLRLETDHFEADTVLEKHKKSCLITLAERVSKYTVIKKKAERSHRIFMNY